MYNAQRKQVLIAVRPEMRETTVELLGTDFIFTFCNTVESAVAHLNDRKFDLIFCTLRFDKSRMFELIRQAKSLPRLNRIPFAAVRLSGGVLSDSVSESALKAAKLLGVEECCDLSQSQRKLGREAADEKLHDRLHDMAFAAPLP